MVGFGVAVFDVVGFGVTVFAVFGLTVFGVAVFGGGVSGVAVFGVAGVGRVGLEGAEFGGDVLGFDTVEVGKENGTAVWTLWCSGIVSAQDNQRIEKGNLVVDDEEAGLEQRRRLLLLWGGTRACAR